MARMGKVFLSSPYIYQSNLAASLLMMFVSWDFHFVLNSFRRMGANFTSRQM
jgi:hypothetical protein